MTNNNTTATDPIMSAYAKVYEVMFIVRAAVADGVDYDRIVASTDLYVERIIAPNLRGRATAFGRRMIDRAIATQGD